MASAKKKQDEKNLKTLRELVSQPGNKECFDCLQRGPTYVNMTIGSFVCTTCSGMLRGLTPPHRVKSISMATFTQEEIDFLKERGNDFCRAIWLGLMPQTSSPNSSKDEQKMKDFMSAKYELKRYYLDPAMASQLLNQKSQNSTKTQSKSSSASVKAPPNKLAPSPSPVPPLSSLPTVTKSKENDLVVSGTTDFVADFSKAPPAPTLPLPTTKFPQPIVQPSFANFDNNPVFDTSKDNQSFFVTTPNNANNTAYSPPPEDRYAALKDLDSLMKQTTLKDEPVSPKSTWNLTDSNNAANLSWSAFEQTSSPFISNPFAGDTWQPSVNNTINNNLNNNLQQANVCSSANPFRQPQVPVFNNDFHWFGSDTQNLENTSSSHSSSLTNKAWQPAVTGFKSNPFAVGTGNGNTTRNSNNPFL
ncbi:hypothetical protein QAD02_015217 [Eretmocerus hayati]|uniref:Uncharacterized protein n=1 Tax=Eretmocerus hayati TaxID=131215 RepID=A0ACC2P7N8_9HYME|nr:hypothetical protein QAD02_015217 [Eretmocerus hayati]